ncbi:phosphatidylserine decarboxylase [Salidesulfovibrio onnuriiensis]|uniref:phosphatidylserine decarboxylase n=1 Tax=Salidesulfovibrio onnuriiensis TaxID=2583823 RepID=UPI0011CC306D|nr:phosphatidylserine decarboxylase [Salidesulfovibrio onnuriiensis]
MKSAIRKLVAAAFVLALAFPAAAAELKKVPSDCPCAQSINRLVDTYQKDAGFRELMDAAFANMQQTPAHYSARNPWMGKSMPDLVKFLKDWCTFLPEIDGTHDTGLKYIQDFALFYYKNPFGVTFVQLSPGREIMQDFVRQRGDYMDSPESTKIIAEWLKDPRIERGDYVIPDPKAKDGGFKSYNEFFSRSLADQAQSRPQTMPDRDYIIAAPTDCVMNSIPQKIRDESTQITTKGNEALNIVDLLGGSKYAKKFLGGTALSCVLMPNTYHHYHSPVAGTVVEAKILEGPFFGHPDFPNWVPPDGNVGYYGATFSPFENFQRGYFIVDTGKYGHVAMVAVGLNTISSVVFKPPFNKLTKPAKVKRGDELGYFLYGGSLFMMIFEPDRYSSDAIQVRLGNQIGTFDTK